MKTKLIAGLTALSVLAFPMSALAAQTTTCRLLIIVRGRLLTIQPLCIQ